MNAKTLITSALAAATLNFALADVSVIDVKCTPQKPWNGLVDVEYTVSCDDPDADVYVNPVAYDGDRRLTLFPSQFTGDGATNTVKAGKHTMVWNAFKDFGAFSSSKFQLKIYAGKRLPRYAWIDLSSGSNSTNYPVHYSVVGPDLSKDDCRTWQLWMRLVPPGEFWMGSPEGELGRSDDEKLHHVTITKPFYIGVFEVTQKQWNLIMGHWPSYFSFQSSSTDSYRDKRPVERVRYTAYYLRYSGGSYYFNWSSSPGIRDLNDPLAVSGYRTGSFIGRLRIRTQNGGWELPTEAQWEYACRAGTTTALNNGKNLTDTTWSQTLAEIGAYYGSCYAGQDYNTGSKNVGTQVVGSYVPNALGLYDMLGNVWELCRDGGGAVVAHSGIDEIDPQPGATYVGKTTEEYWYRIRGGSWKQGASNCRSASNNWRANGEGDDIGFRIFCSDGF